MYYTKKNISLIILIPIAYLLLTVGLLMIGYTNRAEGWQSSFHPWVLIHTSLLAVSILGFVYNSRLIISLSAIYIPLSFLLNQLTYDNLSPLSLIGMVLVFLLLCKASINSFKSKVQIAL